MMNEELTTWVDEVAAHTTPDSVQWCCGSKLEAIALEDRMVANKTLVRLNEQKFLHGFLHRSDPSNVAHGAPDVHLHKAHRRRRPDEQLDEPGGRDEGRMAARMGEVALGELGTKGRFVKGIHSLGDLSPTRRFICHFPQTRTIWSLGYGGNALLSKKCHALRIAGAEAHEEGWLAEHMMIVGITNPKGKKHDIAAAFPSACGKTNLAMLVASLPGWKVETVGDVDPRAWMADAHVNGAFLEKFADRLPASLRREHRSLIERLQMAVS